MVAAGGGGAGYTTGQALGGVGGAAGGLIGYTGVNYATGYGYAQMSVGTGASQNSGGISTNTTYSGKFGIGGYEASYMSTEHGGGGSGYYGGGASTRGHGASGGGSSFISGHNGCNAISETSTADSIVHTEQANHYSGLVFSNTVMVDGQGYNWTNLKGTNTGMPIYDGTSTMTGNSGNGYAKITNLN